MWPPAADRRRRERVAAPSDAYLVDLLAGFRVQDGQDPGVVHEVRAAVVHERRRRVAGDARAATTR